MKWRLVLIAVGSLILVVIILVLSLGIHSSMKGKRELAEIKETIAGQGGKLSADDLNFSQGGSIGPDFEVFTKKVEALSELKQSVEERYGRLRPPQSGIGLYLPIQTAAPNEFGIEDGISWKALHEACQPLRQQWDALVKFSGTHDIHYLPDYLSGPEAKLEQLGSTLNCARMASLLAQFEIQNNQLDRACDYLEEGQTLYRKINPLPQYILIQGLVQISVDAIFLQDVRMILDHADVNEVHLNRIRELFVQPSGLEQLAQALQGERIFFGNWIWDLLRSPQTSDEPFLLTNMMQPNPVEKVTYQLLMTFIYRPFLIDSDQAFYLESIWNIEHFARRAQAGELSYLEHLDSGGKAADFFARASSFERMQKIISSLSLPALEVATRKFVHAETTLRQLHISIELQRYRIKHGRYPETLDVLATLTSRQLSDPVTHQPMLYRPDDELGYILYSRGENGIDDGGEILPREDGDTRQREDNAPDWVWPRPIKK
jgi:hypothetical protein